MPRYVAMLKWTSQGRQNIKQGPSRLDVARKSFEADFANLNWPHLII
jgi:uncharacterized protein with GYD domain